MKKFIAFILSISMIYSMSATAFATTATSNSDNVTVVAFSPEYPNAYLEYGSPTSVAQSLSPAGENPIRTIEVTAFCKEAYDAETGEVLYSQLMSKDEVDAWRAEGSPTEVTPLASWGAIESRGELNITLSVFQLANDGTSGYNTNLLAKGEAYWSKGPSWGAGSTRPSWGSDVIGLSWTKDLDAFNRKASATSNKGDDVDISLCDWSDTEFVSWEFTEQFGFHIGAVGGAEWARSIECSTGLGVPTSVYYQKADIALTYAHSYSDASIDDLSVSVGVSKDGPEGGLDISFGTEASSWKIIAIADGVDL